MGRDSEVMRELLHRHGQTYAEEAGIRLADWPAPLYQIGRSTGLSRGSSLGLVGSGVVPVACSGATTLRPPTVLPLQRWGS